MSKPTSSISFFKDVCTELDQLSERYPRRDVPYAVEESMELHAALAQLRTKMFTRWGAEGDRLSKLDDETQLHALREEAERVLADMDRLELSMTKPIVCCTDEEIFREFCRRAKKAVPTVTVEEGDSRGVRGTVRRIKLGAGYPENPQDPEFACGFDDKGTIGYLSSRR